jgi:carbamoylphosphate synthase large subunit
MQLSRGAEEHRAGFAGIVADGDNVIERLPLKFIDVLGSMAGNINSQFAHDSNRFGAYCAGFGSRASTSKASPASWRSSASAIWLRAEFPVQRMRTRFLSI